MEEKKINECAHDVKENVEGTGVNLQSKNRSEGVKDMNVREYSAHEGKRDVSDVNSSIPATSIAEENSGLDMQGKRKVKEQMI